MAKRLLLTLVALVLLLGLVLGAVWFIQNRRAAEPETPEGSEASLPESGTSSSPATTLEGQPGSSLACPERWTGLPDADSDGLPDTVEALYAANPENADTDSDGHTDGEEVRAGYDPLQKEGNPRLDSDGDGLPENEECQWKSDPFIADSDGDGFKDGDEVKNGFDPTVKGDGKGSDALPERRALEAQVSLERFRPNANSDNLTERLAAQLFGNRPAGELATFSPSPQDIQGALRTLPRNLALPFVGLNDVVVSKENTPAAIAQYLDVVNRAEPLPIDPTTLSGFIKDALVGNPAPLVNVRRSLEAYAQTILQTPTPPTALTYHRTLLGFVRYTIERFRLVEDVGASDPVRAFLALAELQEAAPTQSQSLERLRADLIQIARTASAP